MIVEGLMQAGVWILNAILNALDILPTMPADVVTAINAYLQLVFDNVVILPFFFPVSFAAGMLPVVLILANWKRLYHFIMWVWHKVPISSD